MSNDAYDSIEHDGSIDREAVQPDHQTSTSQTDAENSLAIVLSVWWSFFWRSTLLLVVVSIVINLFILLAVAGDQLKAETYSTIIILLLTIPVGIWSMGKALSVKHKGHRIIFTRGQDSA